MSRGQFANESSLLSMYQNSRRNHTSATKKTSPKISLRMFLQQRINKMKFSRSGNMDLFFGCTMSHQTPKAQILDNVTRILEHGSKPH